MSFYRKYSKVVVALVLCFALVLMPFSFSAQAATPNSLLSQRFSAWLAAAISAVSITLQSTNAPYSDLLNFVVDPFNVVYTYPEQALEEFLDNSVIKITPDKTVIDGVEYSDIWLSYDAANKFRTNAFDFQTGYSITSNTNGTFAEGLGYSSGTPIFSVNGVYRSQDFLIPYEDGHYEIGSCSVDLFSRTRDMGVSYTTSAGSHGPYYRNSSYFPLRAYLEGERLDYLAFYMYGENGSTFANGDDGISSSFVSDPFDFDYVAGTIDAEPLEQTDGLRIRVPSSDLEQFVEDYPEYISSTGKIIDSSETGIDTELGDLSDIIAAILPVIIEMQDMITYEAMDTPAPTYTNIADTNYSILNNTLQNIEDWLSDISSGIQAIPSAIGNLIDGFLNDIEIGPIKVFDKALDLIQSLFAPVFLLIRNGLSIWSYVVTWVNTLSAPLTFMVAVLPAAVWLPVYALVAGTICLAIFRRFGK